ncbi:MAG: DUF3990 domain-containing protein [Bacteroidales bacterium]|nr:DUF3990 domain-containing protein [Bacteroidales bacterium]
MITLYHGSFTIVDKPQADFGRRNLDFGKGFYLTSLRTQAEQWARLITERKTRNGIPQLNVYKFDDSIANGINWLRFDAYNIEWLDYVVACRAGDNVWQQYDIVEGGVANDNVIDTVEDYTMGIITAEQALGQLRYKTVNHQICIISQQVIDNQLKFEEAISLNIEHA